MLTHKFKSKMYDRILTAKTMYVSFLTIVTHMQHKLMPNQIINSLCEKSNKIFASLPTSTHFHLQLLIKESQIGANFLQK